MAHFKSHAPGSFCLFELSTPNQEAAKRFYTSLFGWACADNPNSPVGVYTMFTLDGRDVAGAYTQFKQQTAAGMPPYWDIYISTTSADETAKNAAELGGQVVMPPFDVSTYGRMAVIRDPTGATFCIWEAKTLIGVETKNEPGSFCWVDLITPDPETAAKFYTDLFGWTLLPGEGGYQHLKNGEEFIGGIPPANPNSRPHWMSYAQVKDCDATVAKAQELGSKVLVEPMSIGNVGRMSIIRDPQGGAFAVFEASAPM
jgi:uncharacterized protein